MIDDAPGWVAAGAAVVAAAIVAWQSWETRRSAQASEAAVRAANDALHVSRQQAAEAVRARIDAATPSISVFLASEVDWPPLQPSSHLGGQPNPLTVGVRKNPMHMPRDRDDQLMVRARVRIVNDSDRHVQVELHGLLELNAMTPLNSPASLAPGEIVDAWCAATRRLAEWIDVHRARANPQPGYTSDEVVGTVRYIDPADTGAIDRWELIIGGTPVHPVDELDGGWRIIETPVSTVGAVGAMGTGPVLRQRRYYLSKRHDQELTV